MQNKIPDVWKYYQMEPTKDTYTKWDESQKVVCEVGLIEELLYTLDRIESIDIAKMDGLKFFKNNIRPSWEDPANLNGGKITIDIPFSQRTNLMRYWKTSLFICFSNGFETINGCVFAEKQQTYKIMFWISNLTEADDIVKLWKELNNLPDVLSSISLHNTRYNDYSKNKRKFNRK